VFARNASNTASASTLGVGDRLATFFGFESNARRSASTLLSAKYDRNPDLRARRFLLLAVLMSQLANVTGVQTSILAVGFAATALAFFVREAPRAFIWRSVLLLLTVAAGVLVFLTYGKLIGRDSGIALLFLFGPLKLIEARTTRDYMVVWGLGLVLYVASFFENLGIGAALSLPVVIVAYIAALRLFDSRGDETDAPTIASHVKAASVHTLMGIPLAAMLFVLFPRAAAPLWGMQEQRTGSTGLSEEMEPGEIARLIRNRETAFRVEFEGRRPPQNALYWRGPVLRQFDGAKWSVGEGARRGEFVSITPEQIAREAIVYTVTAERLDTRWLPVLELPVAYPTGPAIEQTAFLTDAQQIGVRRTPNGPTAYRVQSIARPTYPGIAPHSFQAELRTGNARFHPRTRAFAAQLREQFSDPKARVQALLTHFNREPFFYTLEPPAYALGDGRVDSIDRFLFDGRRGFCEHYAGATVFILRASGIPARVVTGYQGGEWQPSGYMIVRQSDAHAWVEAYIDGQWTRIDPTAAVAPNRVELGLSDALSESERSLVNTRRWFETKRLAALWEQANFTYTKWIIGFDRDRQRELMRDLGLGQMNPLTAIGWMLIAVSLSGGVVALAWWITRRRRERKLDINVQIWHKLRKRLVTAGLPIAAHETVGNALARASAQWPQQRPLFQSFTQHYDRNRFAKSATHSSESVAALKSALRELPSARTLRKALKQANASQSSPQDRLGSAQS
jgi:protein-glutamine gamma-glutamyltransferase